MSLSRGLSKVKNFLNLIEVPAILLLVWGAVSHFGLFPEFLLPSPEKVWSSFVELLVCGELWKHIAASAGRVFGGFFLAMLVAIPLAYFFYYSPASEKRAKLLLEALRFIPPLSLIPLLILWLGIGEAAKLSIVFLASFFPIYLNVFSGFKQIDKSYKELAFMLRLNRMERFKHIEFPASLPNIFTGLRLGFGYSRGLGDVYKRQVVSPLKDFSLNLEPGKLTAVLGKSGCGKTTLLKVISGLEERDAGEISFFDEAGRPVSSPKLSLVFQDPRLLPWKTVEENLSLAIRHLPEEERKQRIREVLELVRLPEVEALYPSELSGGMAQRVGLARGIIAKPDLLLLDEPFSALDFMTRSRLQMDFSKIQDELGMTMVLITHDVNEAVLLSDKTVFLEEGKVKQEVNIALPKPRRFGDQNLLPFQQTLFNFFLT